jgi:hypothetical protein
MDEGSTKSTTYVASTVMQSLSLQICVYCKRFQKLYAGPKAQPLGEQFIAAYEPGIITESANEVKVVDQVYYVCSFNCNAKPQPSNMCLLQKVPKLSL